MGLISLTTNLKSLKYGLDKPGGGNSNQPYITTPIPGFDTSLQNNNKDFLLRGGILAPVNSNIDIIRLSRYFDDLKSPSGMFFTIKQNLLSKTAVRTQASGKILNEGVYTPLSTLAQAGVNAFGIHLNKQGLNPIPNSIGSLNTYSEVINNNKNRLTSLYEVKIVGTKQLYSDNGLISTKLDSNNLYSYPGGPGSVLGIGLTNIKFADQRTGINNLKVNKDPKNYLNGISKSPTERKNSDLIKPVGVSTIYGNLVSSENETLNVSMFTLKTNPFASSSNAQYFGGTGPNAVYSFKNGKFGTATVGDSLGGSFTFTQQELIDKIPFSRNPNEIIDFRKILRDRVNKENPGLADNILSDSPDYNSFKIENRVNLGDPGNPFGKNLKSYVSGFDGSGSASSNSYDRINVKPLYKASEVDTKDTNDLVKFRIAAIDNDDPSQKVYIHFRAFLNNIDDSINSEINSINYIGRGEKFYTQGGFEEKVSLSFTVLAQSKIELIPMYKKLNYLKSLLTPDYSKFGYMRGNLITLTIGGYFYEQPGILTSLNYNLPEESPWEIGITDSGTDINKFDSSVKELPHMIKVTNFSFTPIRNFIPRKGNIDKLGDTPFISLSAGGKSNY